MSDTIKHSGYLVIQLSGGIPSMMFCETQDKANQMAESLVSNGHTAMVIEATRFATEAILKRG